MKESTYFDIHAHTQFPQFDIDREQVISRAEEAGIGVINVGTDRVISEKAIGLAEQNENMYAIVGLHPTHADEVFDYDFYKQLARHPKVVAIGECGIDLFRADEASLTKQIEIFEAHLQIAQELNKPVMLHIRNAYTESLEVLQKFPDVKCNVHFFAGDIEIAKKFLDLGHTLSFTGAITFPKAEQYIEVIKSVPLDRIMAETDCPFVAPVPYRGERCEPSHVLEVYKKIAEIKNLYLEDVAKQIRENVRRVFAI